MANKDAKKTRNDDIFLELENARIPVVYLTWKSEKEVEGYPITKIYRDKIEFWEKEMRKDVAEYKK